MNILFVNTLMNSKTIYSRVLMNELRRNNKSNNIFYIEIDNEHPDLCYFYINNFIKE